MNYIRLLGLIFFPPRKDGSEIDGIRFSYHMSDLEGYVFANKLNLMQRILFIGRVTIGFIKCDWKLKRTIKKAKCYYGPFKGEFGHFLAHTLPFVSYLHKENVQVKYCGMALHEAFLIDENGKAIVDFIAPLRDFFAEVSPKSNSTIVPPDVKNHIDAYKLEASNSNVPYWNIDDDFFYWFIFRNWVSIKNSYCYNLSRKASKENSCVIMPRNKGKVTENNGEGWDYNEITMICSSVFDKVYICGHPSQTTSIDVNCPNVEICIGNNEILIDRLSRSKICITQHSGAVYACEYTNTDVLLIHKGAKDASDIGSLNNTLRFKKNLAGRSKLNFAFNTEQIITFIESKHKNT